MWIKTQNGNWVDTNKISAVVAADWHVKVVVDGVRVRISRFFETDADTQAAADDFVAKYLKEDNHVD